MPGNPPTLIDKSFLQSLSLDEAYWFFTYFDGVLTPVLIAEIIGDIEKEYRDGRDPSRMVSSLAGKLCRTPSKLFNVSHAELSSYELLGETVKMEMRPVVYGARLQNSRGELIEVSDNSAFLDMLQALEDGEYRPEQIVRAKAWREYASQFDPGRMAQAFSDFPPPPELSELNLDLIRDLQAAEILRRENGRTNLLWAFSEFNIPDEGRRVIEKRWIEADKPSLYEFAPYTAFTILAIRTHMFASALELTGGKQKSSDIVDMEYLLYVPFCRFFASNDKFQLRFFRQLAEEGQFGVIGSDLKLALGEIVDHFGGSPLSKAPALRRGDVICPPKSLDNRVTKMWDLAKPDWRNRT